MQHAVSSEPAPRGVAARGEGTSPPRLRLALSALCENPRRPTGLSTLFPEMVRESLRLFPGVDWVVFVGPDQPWPVVDARVETVRDFPANDRPFARLWADHRQVGPAARARGAGALLTTGFVPAWAPLPVAMQVVTLHHLRADFGGGTWRRIYRQRAVRRGLERAGLVIANSRYTATRLQEAGTVEASRLLISPEGLDHARFHPRVAEAETDEFTREWQLRPGYVLWASNFYDYKRADWLLRAFAALPASLRAAHPLVAIGGDWQGGRAAAQQVAQELGIAREVRWLDWVPDRWLPVFYRHAMVHALPSTEETFGKSVAEAMACGCPCLVNDIPALAETGGDAARRVNFGATAEAAAALREMLENSSTASELRARGLRRAAEWSYERLARERVGAMVERWGPRA